MARNILLVELNEITWDLIDPLIQRGRLPTFAKLKREGAWGAPTAVEEPTQLDPWVTWTTLLTGRAQSEHNVHSLRQPPESIKARRLWEICADNGLSVGVYGSVCSWPPRSVNGFWVPDTFSPDPSTFPSSLEPIQRLNLTYTRTVRLPSDEDNLGFKLKLGAQLTRLGLGLSAMTAISKQLISEVAGNNNRWRRAALQPIVNFSFFSKLYREHRPRFATFHSNHVAHYQHTYWKAMDPDKFRPLETSEEERNTYGGAIEFGYVVADRLLADSLRLVDDNTTLIVASSLGQKPYVSKYEGGKPVQQLRSHKRLLEILGVDKRASAVSAMSDEFVINCADKELRDHIAEAMTAAWVDDPERKLFHISYKDDSVRVNLRVYDSGVVKSQSTIHFPMTPGAPEISYEDLIYNTGHLKSGCHDPRGMVIFYGKGITPGTKLGDYNNLDFAPTFLKMLGLPPAPEMSGQVMHEVV